MPQPRCRCPGKGQFAQHKGAQHSDAHTPLSDGLCPGSPCDFVFLTMGFDFRKDGPERGCVPPSARPAGHPRQADDNRGAGAFPSDGARAGLRGLAPHHLWSSWTSCCGGRGPWAAKQGVEVGAGLEGVACGLWAWLPRGRGSQARALHCRPGWPSWAPHWQPFLPPGDPKPLLLPGPPPGLPCCWPVRPLEGTLPRLFLKLGDSILHKLPGIHEDLKAMGATGGVKKRWKNRQIGKLWKCLSGVSPPSRIKTSETVR